jgi:hypothetical protein
MMPGLLREGVKVKTGAVMAAVVTVAMVAADNNRNGGGRQQSTKCNSGSGGDSITEPEKVGIKLDDTQ